jgi:hypothetical protein
VLRPFRDSLNWSGLDLEPSTDEEYDAMADELAGWVTIKQAAEHYQISGHTARKVIAIGQLRAKHIGPRTIRNERDSLLELGDQNTSRAQKPIRESVVVTEQQRPATTPRGQTPWVTANTVTSWRNGAGQPRRSVLRSRKDSPTSIAERRRTV